ncbi:MAG TPA: hypothetical protein VGS07_17895 [Thermoanaerobaculia bacterium]|jgi:hypothetical protein|nr:hypothetical protein [Thermoanaerobaculia bacterium]
MGCTSLAHSAEITKSTPPRQRSGPPLAAWAAGLVFLVLVLSGLSAPAAQAQSCTGKAAGDVCRPSAGGCDVAETCVPTGGNPGTAMYTPTDGSLATNAAWAYTMGYAFTPSQTITVTALGGYFNGTKTVYLYDRTTGAVLASATVTAVNGWAYASIAPVTLTKLMPYSVAVNLGGSGGAYRINLSSLPSVAAAASIDGSCYRAGSTAEPCASSGLIAGTNYGMADLKYLPAQPLYEPADGALYTDVPGDYTTGYAFTPNKNLTVTHLGGLYNGTRTVSLYNRSTGALLASVSNPSANAWSYKTIPPITLTAGTSYTVAVYSGGTGNAYRTGLTSMPSVRADATIEGTCSRAGNSGEPCSSSGLISGVNYGMADIKYTATGGVLTCPADSFLSTGTVCRAASGSCDVAETCSGTSAACPANTFVAAGVSCNDSQLCTYNDVCNGAGSCGGTAITCGGGNACSTTMCNGTSTCDVAKVFCDTPPGECYNTLGSCNTTNGSCSYTVKVGAPCGAHGTCLSSGVCNPSLPITTLSVPVDCATQTIPAPTPIGCDSCDPNHPCVVDSTVTVPVEYQTCSGYTPRKGDIVLHDAVGLTQLLVSNFGTHWTHVGVFLDPQPSTANQTMIGQQMVRHQAINLDGLAQSVIQAGLLKSFLIGLSLDKNSAYCKAAKLNPATLFDSGQFTPGVPNTHSADMTKELDGNGTLFWEDGVVDRHLVIAANRAAGEDVANRMMARDDYYSLNSLVDDVKGYNRLNAAGKHGTNCASAIMSCITPEVPRTLLTGDKMRQTANLAYEAIRHQARHMQETEDAVSHCKLIYGCYFGYCPVDCDGLAWEAANGIADQVIACFLFGPTGTGCDCTRDNRKWHFASWAGAPAAPPTQDDIDWVNGRMTDVEFVQDPWTGSAAQGQPAMTIYPSYTYLPSDVLKSGNYPPGNEYPLIKKTNATRKYGHCYAPLTLTVTPSPASSQTGTTITWTATATGGSGIIQYAFFRRPSGTTPWTPPVTAPTWGTGNVFTWTPGAGDAGSWDIYVWVKDSTTTSIQNTYGYAAGANPGGVLIQGPQQAYPAKGWVDGFNNQHIWGWACDPDNPAQSNRVDFWTTSGQGLGSAGANLTSNAGVTSACLGGTAHGFDFYPSGGIPSGTHFNVWSIDLPYNTPGNDNRKCGGAGSIGDGTEFVIPCTDCNSAVCCGAAGNSACDGQQHFDPNTGYTGVCQATLGACSATNDFDGTNNVFHNGDIVACAKRSGVYGWVPRRPSPRCQEVSPVCDYLCANHNIGGAGFMCDQNGNWNTSLPLANCYGGTIPSSYLCP